MPESLPSASTTTTPTPTPAPAPAPHAPSPPPKAHILVTGASSGIGRAFFEHFSSFPPTTNHVRGIDARPFPTNPKISTCAVGASGHYTQIDLTAEALVQKFVRGATVPGAAARSRASSSSSSASPSPTQTHHHHHHQPGQPSLTPPASSNVRSNSNNNEPPYVAPFTLVIHSAGIRGLVPSAAAAAPADVGAAETIAAMDAATMRRTYEVNAVATFTLIKALLPSLLQATTTNSSPPPSRSPPKVVVMSSRMGSVASNGSGGAYAYRASKAALNAVVRSFSVDVPEVVFALVHPGRVETGLVGTREEGAVDVKESVGDMLALIGRMGSEDGLRSGCFVDRWGKEIPW